MPDPLIRAQALSCTFQQGGRPVVAVKSADFQIRAGDRIAVMGPSGCGKSTLLHLMGGLVRATSGTITWPGLGAIEDLRPAHIAMVFQGPSLMPELTAGENVALPGLLANGDLLSGDAATAALALFDLEPLADKLPEQMSGGQMQRVALARAVAGRPKLILADEPTGQLDQATRDDMLDRLLAHLVGLATALVITAHDPAVAARLQTVWHMSHGKLLSDARTSEAEA